MREFNLKTRIGDNPCGDGTGEMWQPLVASKGKGYLQVSWSQCLQSLIGQVFAADEAATAFAWHSCCRLARRTV